MNFGGYWWLLFWIPGLILGIYAQVKLTAAYNRYRQVPVESGLTGGEAARIILDRAGLANVPISEVGGHLTDHYDPRKRALFLSSENLRGQSIAAVGVAAHEAGHALQHKDSYALLNFRMAMVPITQVASTAWMGILVLGGVLGLGFFSKLLWIAVAIFAVITLFQLVTLPVEFNASRRAKEQLLSLGLIHSNESDAVSRVLGAAALTYVAALVSAVLQLARLVLVARNRN